MGADGDNTELPGVVATPPKDPAVIGVVTKPVGLRGDVVVSSALGDLAFLRRLGSVILQRSGSTRAVELRSAKRVGRTNRVGFVGVDSREQAALIRGCQILIEAINRPALGGLEFYIDEVAGSEVASERGVNLGRVVDVWQGDHHDIWVIDGPKGEVLVPVVSEFILSIDGMNKRIIIKHAPELWGEDG